MTTLIVYWSVVLAVSLFLVGTIFHIITSLLVEVVNSIDLLIKCVSLFFSLYIIYLLVDAFSSVTPKELVPAILILLIMIKLLSFFVVPFFEIAKQLLELVSNILTWLLIEVDKLAVIIINSSQKLLSVVFDKLKETGGNNG